MKLSDLTYKETLQIPEINKVVNELSFADLSDNQIVQSLIKQIFALFNKLNLDASDNGEFYHALGLIQDLLSPLETSGYLTISTNDDLSSPFIIISADPNKAANIFEERVFQVYLEDLLIDAHIDVFPYMGSLQQGYAAVKTDDSDNEYLFARGANDMLSQVCSVIVLVYRLYRNGIKCPFITLSSDEEQGNPFSAQYYKKIHAPAAISLEPTGDLLAAMVNEVSAFIAFSYELPESIGNKRLEIQASIHQFLAQFPEFKNIRFNITAVNKTISFSFGYDPEFNNQMEKFFKLLENFLRKQDLKIGPKRIDTLWEGSYSLIDRKFKQEVLKASLQTFGPAKFIEDDFIDTRGYKGAGNNNYTLRGSQMAFQTSLTCFLPTRPKNTVIFSFPEEGRRHSANTEHVDLRNPANLEAMLFEVVKNYKVQQIES